MPKHKKEQTQQQQGYTNKARREACCTELVEKTPGCKVDFGLTR